jgi:bifunctional aspartokinase / homoserine dehydrogenase 1
MASQGQHSVRIKRTNASEALNLADADSRGFANHTSKSVSGPHFARRATSFCKPLRVMKFGGTSVGDASCITKVSEIVRTASHECHLVVVVSAMNGITDKLIEATEHSASGNFRHAAAILEGVRKWHAAAARALIHSQATRNRLRRKTRKLCQHGDRLCQEAARLCGFTPRARDEMASLGERLAVLLLAAALAEQGIASKAVEATGLIVTNSNHGAADPRMHLTRKLCEVRLRPLLRQGIVPVVTGFIGATSEGVLTTLGRGGSDYSATILAAALDADEVVIWKNVDGLLTADPRLVPEAGTIPEISYKEAGDLAEFGAKVLHRKTLRPIIGRGIFVRIRNTFAPEASGTIIRGENRLNDKGTRALVGIRNAALISIYRPGIAAEIGGFLARGRATGAIRECVPMTPQPLRQHQFYLAVPADLAECAVAEVRNEFGRDLSETRGTQITVHHGVAIVTLAGQHRSTVFEMGRRMSVLLAQANVNVMATGERSPGYGFSFVVAQRHLRAALVSAHREFCLDGFRSRAAARRIP